MTRRVISLLPYDADFPNDKTEWLESAAISMEQKARTTARSMRDNGFERDLRVVFFVVINFSGALMPILSQIKPKSLSR